MATVGFSCLSEASQTANTQLLLKRQSVSGHYILSIWVSVPFQRALHRPAPTSYSEDTTEKKTGSEHLYPGHSPPDQRTLLPPPEAHRSEVTKRSTTSLILTQEALACLFYSLWQPQSSFQVSVLIWCNVWVDLQSNLPGTSAETHHPS